MKATEALNDFEQMIFDEKCKNGMGSTRISRSVKKIFIELMILEDKLWFNRHQVLKSKVHQGLTHVDEKVWQDALIAAQRILSRYPAGALGPWTDFEWGMINGKISTLRWLLGNEWDWLDS